MASFLASAVNLRMGDLIEQAQGGVGLQHVTRRQLENLKIPLPSPDEPERSLSRQSRIVKRVEALASEIDRCRTLLKQMRRDAERVLAATVDERLDRAWMASSDWITAPLHDICERPQYGYTASATPEKVGPKFVRISDIQDGRIDWRTVPYCSIPQEKLDRYLLRRNDIVFARTGATTGKTALVEEGPRAVFASYLIRLRVRGQVLPEFLWWFFQSSSYWRQVKPRGAAQGNMNAALLNDLRVLYPSSLESQAQIVAHLNLVRADIEQVIPRLQEDDELLDRVQESLLQQAIRGAV